MTGSDTFHHGALEVEREQQLPRLGIRALLLEEAPQRLDVHHRRVENLALEKRHLLLQDRRRAILGDELVAHVGRVRTTIEFSRRRSRRPVIGATCDVESADQRPSLWGASSETLHRERRAAVRSCLTKHRVDGAPSTFA